jgi:glutamate dehydrogenase/leucine dehydrogenase
MTSADGVFGLIEAAGAEHVAFCRDPAAGLRALVVIGSTALGPALCGVRVQPYPDAGAALADGLRLAEVMTVKSAAAGVRLGGGSIIVLDGPRSGKDARLLAALARQLSGCRGRVLAVNDAGSTTEDIAALGAAGADVCAADPSPYTALGVVECIRAGLEARWPGRTLAGSTIAVQGAGNVGSRVAGLLRQENASVLISDTDAGRADRVAAETGARVLPPGATCCARARSAASSPRSPPGTCGAVSSAAARTASWRTPGRRTSCGRAASPTSRRRSPTPAG